MINEYVHIHQAQHSPSDGCWVVFYEPLEYTPLEEGSLVGTIYDGGCISEFTEHDGSLYSYLGNRSFVGRLLHNFGQITLYFSDPPSEDHYLQVCYEVIDDVKVESMALTGDWRKEGF